MDRKSFFRNSIGALAAVAIGSKIESLFPIPADVPGVGGTVFNAPIKASFIRGTFRPYDIILMDGGKREVYLTRKDDNTITGIDIHTGEPILEIDETEKYNFLIMDLGDPRSINEYHSGGHSYVKISSSIPENAQQCKEDLLSASYSAREQQLLSAERPLLKNSHEVAWIDPVNQPNLVGITISQQRAGTG